MNTLKNALRKRRDEFLGRGSHNDSEEWQFVPFNPSVFSGVASPTPLRNGSVKSTLNGGLRPWAVKRATWHEGAPAIPPHSDASLYSDYSTDLYPGSVPQWYGRPLGLANNGSAYPQSVPSGHRRPHLNFNSSAHDDDVLYRRPLTAQRAPPKPRPVSAGHVSDKPSDQDFLPPVPPHNSSTHCPSMHKSHSTPHYSAYSPRPLKSSLTPLPDHREEDSTSPSPEYTLPVSPSPPPVPAHHTLLNPPTQPPPVPQHLSLSSRNIPLHASQFVPPVPPHNKPLVPPHNKPAVPQHNKPAVPQHNKPAVPPHNKPAVPPHNKPAVPPHNKPAMPPHNKPAVPPHGNTFRMPTRRVNSSEECTPPPPPPHATLLTHSLSCPSAPLPPSPEYSPLPSSPLSCPSGPLPPSPPSRSLPSSPKSPVPPCPHPRHIFPSSYSNLPSNSPSDEFVTSQSSTSNTSQMSVASDGEGLNSNVVNCSESVSNLVKPALRRSHCRQSSLPPPPLYQNMDNILPPYTRLKEEISSSLEAVNRPLSVSSNLSSYTTSNLALDSFASNASMNSSQHLSSSSQVSNEQSQFTTTSASTFTSQTSFDSSTGSRHSPWFVPSPEEDSNTLSSLLSLRQEMLDSTLTADNHEISPLCGNDFLPEPAASWDVQEIHHLNGDIELLHIVEEPRSFENEGGVDWSSQETLECCDSLYYQNSYDVVNDYLKCDRKLLITEDEYNEDIPLAAELNDSERVSSSIPVDRFKYLAGDQINRTPCSPVITSIKESIPIISKPVTISNTTNQANLASHASPNSDTALDSVYRFSFEAKSPSVVEEFPHLISLTRELAFGSSRPRSYHGSSNVTSVKDKGEYPSLILDCNYASPLV